MDKKKREHSASVKKLDVLILKIGRTILYTLFLNRNLSYN